MARTKSQAFPTGILLLLLALAASAALLGYLVLSPAEPDTAGDLPGSADNADNTLEFEFYDRLPENEVQVNSPADEPAEPGPADFEQLAELLTTDSQVQPENATEALEQIAETIVDGLETPAPDRVAPPEPVPPVPVAPRSQAETVLAAPAPAEARSRPGTVLQSGAFSRQERALSELQRQRSLGLEVEMRQRPGQDGPMFLLQSGPYDSRDRLEEAELVFRLNDIPTARLSLP